MSIEVTCSQCGKTLQAKDSAAGKSAKCPQCGGTIKIPAAQPEVLDAELIAEPVETALYVPMSNEPPPPEDMTARFPCPKCGEQIPLGAAKCRFCQTIFDPRLAKASKKSGPEDENLTVAEWIVAILCSGIGCIAGIIWMIQGKPKGKKMLIISLIVQVIWVIIRVIIDMSSSRY
jgi:predicted RNA-binding Zn-ribbon protein involved in translation (DUF1610 family)